jgi:Concanavalin A-like lectin/glucanases superfamily
MANTTIKITQLPSIGNNLTSGTLIPVVAVNGITPVTDKTTVGNIANFTLTNAGNTLPPALLSVFSQTVTNAAQPNITSVGTLNVNTLNISGGVNGQYLQTDGAGNLAWVSGGGSGNGVVGGSDTQIQFNNAGNFGGDPALTWDQGNAQLNTVHFAATSATIYGDINAINLNASANIRPNAIYTNNYFYSNGEPFNGGGSSSNQIFNGISNVDIPTSNGNVYINSSESGNYDPGNEFTISSTSTYALPSGFTFISNAVFDPNYSVLTAPPFGTITEIINNGSTINAISFYPGEPSALTTHAIVAGSKVMFSVVLNRESVANSGYNGIGVASHSMNIYDYLGSDNNTSVGFYEQGEYYGDTDGNPQPAGYVAGDIIDVAVDRANNLIWNRINGGDWNNNPSANPSTQSGGFILPAFGGAAIYPGVTPTNYNEQGPNTWDFDTTGNLTMPGQSSGRINWKPRFAPSYVNAYMEFGQGFQISSYGSLGLTATNDPVVGVDGIVFSGAGYTNGTYTDQPTTGGSGIGLTLNYTVNLTQVVDASVENSGYGYLNGDVVTIPGGSSNATVLLYVNTSASNWNFGNDGNVTLPNDTFGFKYANGDPVIVSSANIGNITFNASTISTNLANTDIQINGNGVGNVSVSTNANSWIFGSDGNLTLPGTSGGFVMTNNGNVTYSSNSPFEDGSGSLNFPNDGNTHYLNTPNESRFAPGTGDFTIEWYQYMTNDSHGYQRPFCLGALTQGTGIFLTGLLEGGSTIMGIQTGTGYTPFAGYADILNSWQHIAVVRNSGVITIYQNGVAFASHSIPNNITYNPALYLSVGNPTGGPENIGTQFVGQITNMRYVVGTAVYTSNFTTSTTPLTAISGTQMLLAESPDTINFAIAPSVSHPTTLKSNGDINVVSSGNTWKFDHLGNLTLPSNFSNINYANGSPYGAPNGPSGSMQVNWQGGFSDQGGTPGDTYSSLQFDGNGIPTLNGTNAYQQRVNYSPYMQVLSPRVESTDYGIVAGPGVTVVGYDDNYNTPRSAYVSVQDQANATQQWDFGILGNGDNNFVVSDRTSSNVWSFGTDGNLTLPSNASSINYANGSPYGGGGSSNKLVNGSYNFTLGVDGTLNIDPSTNGKGVLQTTADLQFISGTNTWTFSTDGNLTASGSGTFAGNNFYIGPGANTQGNIGGSTLVISSNDTAYVQASIFNVSDVGSADWAAYGHHGDDNGGWIDMGFNSSGYSDANYNISGPGDGALLVQSFYENQAPGGRGGNLILGTGENGTVNDIIFGTGGFSNTNIFGRISNANNSFELSRSGASITLPAGGEIKTAVGTGNVVIEANDGTVRTWTFKSIGTLNLPDFGAVPGSGDGAVGDMCRNGDVLYFKTSTGWKTVGLS